MRKGVTFAELLVVGAILLTLITLATINLLPPQYSAATASAETNLLADIRAQQLKAMLAQTSSGATTPYGLYFAGSSYALFSGPTYSAGASSNFVVEPPAGISFTTNLTNNSLVFAIGSGEVVGYSASASTITVTNTNNSQTVTLTLNPYGVATTN